MKFSSNFDLWREVIRTVASTLPETYKKKKNVKHCIAFARSGDVSAILRACIYLKISQLH